MDIVESGVNRTGMAIKVPVGIIVAIVPSNSPVNLTVNKVRGYRLRTKPEVLKVREYLRTKPDV